MSTPKVKLGEYRHVRVPFEDLKNAVEENIVRYRMSLENAERKAKEDLAAKEIVKRSQIQTSEEEVTARAVQMMEAYALRLQQQGLSIEGYYRTKKTNEQELLEQMKEKARKQIQARMVLAAVAQSENLEATVEEYDREVHKLAVRYLMSKEQVNKILQGEEGQRIRQEIAVEKAAKFLAANVKVNS